MLRWEPGVAREEWCDWKGAQDFSVLQLRPAHRQRAELGSALREWIAAWLPEWKSGSMLAIDYGNTLPDIYHRRPHGTLRAYLMQQRLEGHEVYQNVGRQDITADVNFTDVRAWLSEGGCKEQFYQTQGQFLTRTGSEADQAFHCLAVRR
jgi:SAM-dependent MidA family methyltransferase